MFFFHYIGLNIRGFGFSETRKIMNTMDSDRTFDTLRVFLKDFFLKNEKYADDKSHEKLPNMHRTLLTLVILVVFHLFPDSRYK